MPKTIDEYHRFPFIKLAAMRFYIDMDYKIREIRKNEYPILSDFLYETIFIPKGMDKPPKSIIEQPKLQVYIDDTTPSFAISLYEEYRNWGIGTALMGAMLQFLRVKGYKQTSLSVQKANYAVHMYRKAGFEMVDENEEEYITLYGHRYILHSILIQFLMRISQ